MMMDEQDFKEYNKTLMRYMASVLIVCLILIVIFTLGIAIFHYFDMIQQDLYDRFENNSDLIVGALYGFLFAFMLVALYYLDHMNKVKANERKAEISTMRYQIGTLRNRLLEDEQTIEVLRDQLKNMEPTEASEGLQTDESDEEEHV